MERQVAVPCWSLAALAFVGAAAVAVVAGGHRPPAAAAADDALTQGVAFSGRAGAGVGAVGGELGLVGEVVVPAEVAGVVVVDADLPVGHRLAGDAGVHAAVRADAASGGVAAEHVGAGVGGVGQDAQHPGVVEPAPAQLPGPRPAVGALREAAPGERAPRPGRPTRSRRTRRTRHATAAGDLLVGVDHDVAVVVVQVADRQRCAQLARGPRRPVSRPAAVRPAGAARPRSWCPSVRAAAGR